MGKLISLIYFYLISAIGLILLIIGLYNAVSYGVNITQYDKYPLRYAGNASCDYLVTQPAPVVAPTSGQMPSQDINVKENVRQQRLCEERVALERKQTQVDDMKNSIYFTLVGTLLLAIHLPIAVRKSREEKKR